MTQAIVVGSYANTAQNERTYIAQLAGKANFDRPSVMPRGTDRKAAVVNELARVNRNVMQGVGPALDALKAQGLINSYEVNPLSNTITYRVADDVAAESWKAVNKVDGIGRIVRDRHVSLVGLDDVKEGQRILMTVAGGQTPGDATKIAVPATGENKVEWNVERVNAPQVWEQGFTGKGVTVGIVDTGVDVEHPALRSKYRGTGADGNLDHNYNFFDATSNRKDAYDDNRHGTHVAGTVLGSTDNYTTGMAPDAKWIASKILTRTGSGTMQGVMKGLEWMLAPTDSNGENPDPAKAPDLVNNSWGTGNGSDQSFRKLLQAFLAAGIEPVFAAGNSGPRARSLGAPGSSPEAISVAASDRNDKVANFSSRGPSPIKDDKGSDQKPDITAPGHQITSTLPGGGYGTLSGTSMASPGVAGVIALLLSKYKDLSHDEIMTAITTTAKDIDTPGYDYNSGHGLIDAQAALAKADEIVAARAK